MALFPQVWQELDVALSAPWGNSEKMLNDTLAKMRDRTGSGDVAHASPTSRPANTMIQDVVEFVRHLNSRLQGPVPDEQMWFRLREFIELWTKENTAACWRDMHDTPYEKPRASQIARAAAGLWAISSALKEAAPHVLKYTTVVELHNQAFSAYQAAEALLWCSQWELLGKWKASQTEMQRHRERRQGILNEAVKRLRKDIADTEAARAYPALAHEETAMPAGGFAQSMPTSDPIHAKLRDHCQELAQAVVPAELCQDLLGPTVPDLKQWLLDSKDPSVVAKKLQELWVLLHDLPEEEQQKKEMLQHFLVAFNKSTASSWILDSNLICAVNAVLSSAQGSNDPRVAQKAHARAAQCLQMAALRCERLQSQLIKERKVLAVSGQSLDVAGMAARADDPATMRGVAETLRLGGEDAMAGQADRTATEAELQAAKQAWWRGLRCLALSIEACDLESNGDAMSDGDDQTQHQQYLLASAAAVLLPSAGSNCTAIDAVLGVRLFCRAERVQEALHWATSTSLSDSAQAAVPWSQFVQNMPELQQPTLRGVLQGLLLKWCWDDSIRENSECGELAQLIPEKAERLNRLIQGVQSQAGSVSSLSEEEQMLLQYLESRPRTRQDDWGKCGEGQLGRNLAAVCLFQRNRIAHLLDKTRYAKIISDAKTPALENAELKDKRTMTLARAAATTLHITLSAAVRDSIALNLSNNSSAPTLDKSNVPPPRPPSPPGYVPPMFGSDSPMVSLGVVAPAVNDMQVEHQPPLGIVLQNSAIALENSIQASFAAEAPSSSNRHIPMGPPPSASPAPFRGYQAPPSATRAFPSLPSPSTFGAGGQTHSGSFNIPATPPTPAFDAPSPSPAQTSLSMRPSRDIPSQPKPLRSPFARVPSLTPAGTPAPHSSPGFLGHPGATHLPSPMDSMDSPAPGGLFGNASTPAPPGTTPSLTARTGLAGAAGPAGGTPSQSRGGRPVQSFLGRARDSSLPAAPMAPSAGPSPMFGASPFGGGTPSSGQTTPQNRGLFGQFQGTPMSAGTQLMHGVSTPQGYDRGEDSVLQMSPNVRIS